MKLLISGRVILLMAAVALIGVCASEATAFNQTNKIDTSGYKGFNPFDLSANKVQTNSNGQEIITSASVSKNTVVMRPTRVIVQNKCKIPHKPHHRSPHVPHC